MLNSKKCLGVLVLILIAFLTSPMLLVPVSAWKVPQHVAMADIVQEDSADGNVNINGVEYEANSLVAEAISLYPQYYKMGAIGPDGYPDMMFGQQLIHPDTRTEVGGDGTTYSYEWFDHLLRHVVQKYDEGDISTYRKALAFTYGFMTHGAGDMFMHTFVNRYTGGPFELVINGIRHIVVEGYVAKKTEWSPHSRIMPMTWAEYQAFLGDDAFHNFLYSTFIDNDWARSHTKGFWADLLGLFLDLKDQINTWLRQWEKPWYKRKWWAIAPVGLVTKPYFEHWRDDITDGLKAWVKVSSGVAYEAFILEDWDALNKIKDWFKEHFFKMIGFPDVVVDLANYISDVVGWVKGLLKNSPGIKQIWTFFVNLWNEMQEAIADWALEQVFGVTLSELKDILMDPETPLGQEWLFGDAPFGIATKAKIDEELSAALAGGGFDPFAFDPSYNTITMSKLMLLDGAGLNQLIYDYQGGRPLYAQVEASHPRDLLRPRMSVMRSFIKSLDGNHQWMQTAPTDGRSYGRGMPLWENSEARERVFKKIFHFGAQVWVTPESQATVTGQQESIQVRIVNTGNKEDTFNIQSTVEGDGTFTWATDDGLPPSSITLPAGGETSYEVTYVYDGNEEVTGARLNVTATPTTAPEPPEISGNQESATVVVFAGQIKYLWVTVDEPKLFTRRVLIPLPGGYPDFPFGSIPPSRLLPDIRFVDNTYITSDTHLHIWAYSEAEIEELWFRFRNDTVEGDWLDLEVFQAGWLWSGGGYWQYTWAALYGLTGHWNARIQQHYPWVEEHRAFKLEELKEFTGVWLWAYRGPSDGRYFLDYYSVNVWGEESAVQSYTLILDNTAPSTTWEISGSPIDVSFPYIDLNTRFTLDPADELSGVNATYFSIDRIEDGSFLSTWLHWSLYEEPFNITGPAGTYRINYYSVDNLGNKETTKFIDVILLGPDTSPPSTDLEIGEPSYPAALARAYVTGKTPFSLDPTDGTDLSATGVAQSSYRIYNATYDTNWLPYTTPFTLEDFSDGVYNIDFNSTDGAGNVEPTNTATVILFNPVDPQMFDTPVGTSVIIELIDALARAEAVSELILKIEEVITRGNTTAFPLHIPLPDPPKGYMLFGDAFEVTTTAEYEGLNKISVRYDATKVVEEEGFKLMKLDRDTLRWNDITTQVDPVNDIIHGEAPSLSTFAVMEWTGVTPPVTVDVGSFPSLDQNIVAFPTSEAEVNLDLNGDGDTDDQVIRYYDLSTKTLTNTGAVGANPSVSGNVIAFHTGVIKYYDISNGSLTNTDAAGVYPSVSGSIIAFHTQESGIGVDLNGDGDTNDRVIRYYDISTGTITNTYVAGAVPSVDGNIIAFYTDEVWIDQDLNGDNATDDRVLRYYDISTGIVTNTGALVGIEPPSGLVSWWPADGHAFDIVDANHGTLVNGATFAPGKVGQAFSFDGIDDYVEIPYDPSFNLSSFTLEAWVKFTQNDIYASIISRPNGGNPTDGFSFFRLSNAWGGISGGVQGEGQAYSVSVSTGSFTFADGNWHMASFVRNVEANEISIHVDGVLYGSYPDSSPGDMEHNFQGVIIGSTDGSTGFFEGLIDEVEIYNRALSASEIQAIYEAGMAGKPKPAFADTIASGARPSVDGNIIAFSTNEAVVGMDLNGDGDTNDRVIRYYDISTATVTNTGAEGSNPSLSGNLIAFTTSESMVNKDLNRDGDTSDSVLRYYDISTGNVTNTAEASEHPSIYGNLIAFPTPEWMINQDLNGDGDTNDHIIRYVTRVIPQPPLPPTSVIDIITAPLGGTVTNLVATASVEILSGALTQDATITIDQVPEEEYGEFLVQNQESIASTEVIEIGLGDATLTQLATVTLAYDETQVDETQPEQLQVYSSEDNIVWQIEQVASVDTTLNTVSVLVSSFSYFVIIRDTEPATTELTIETPQYIDEAGNTYVTSATEFTLTATDAISGPAYTNYRINNGAWTLYRDPFNLTDPDRPYTIDYFTIDFADNRETFKSTTAILDTTPPATELAINTYYVDETGNIYVTSDTQLTATDTGSGVAQTFYKINSGDWIEYIDALKLTGPDGTYTIDYYSVDKIGNEEAIRSETVILTSLKVDSYLTDSDFNPITYFDVIFAKDKTEGYKLVATNPGQFYYNINITNNWPITVDTLTIDVSLPADFVLKGAMPIHIYLDGVDITDLCTIDGTTIIVPDVPAGSRIHITVHIDYALKGNTYTSPDNFQMKTYPFATAVSGSSSNSGGSLTGTYASSATLITHQKKTTAIVGFVTDANGNPMANALVELFDAEGNLIATTVTDENGFYYFLDIDPQDYTIQVTHNGQTYTQATTATKGELTQVNFKIE